MSETGSLLVRWRDGDDSARDHLVARLHSELQQIAAARLRREHSSSLSTGDLINESVVRLIAIDPDRLSDRAHVLALASRLMRNILVDHARHKSADRRAHVRVELSTRVDGEQRLDLIAIDSALIRLRAVDPQLSDLVEMRYFGGMTIEDVAVVMQMSVPTLKRRWRVARAWLAAALDDPVSDDRR